MQLPEKYEELFAKQLEFERERFGQEEKLPFYYVFDTSGQVKIVAAVFRNDRDKDNFSIKMKEMCSGNNVDAIVSAMESWMVHAPREEGLSAEDLRKKIGQPSQHPERKEAIIVGMETRHGCKMVHAVIEHTKDKKRVLGPWSPDDVTDVGGRLFGFLSGPKAAGVRS